MTINIENLLIDITKQFITHWNSLDFEAIKNFLRDEVVVISPNIQVIYPENTNGKIIGKENVMKYWMALNEKSGPFEFTLESFNKLENMDYQVYTISIIKGQSYKLYTWYIYNEYGKISELKFEYK